MGKKEETTGERLDICPRSEAVNPSTSTSLDCPPPQYSDLTSSTSNGSHKDPPSNNYQILSTSEDQIHEVNPPDFSVYQASYKTDSFGNITSHDPHLNQDGEALCRFILLHTSTPPEMFVKISGTHEDIRIEHYTEIVNGRTEFRSKEHRQTITDFSFTLSLPSEQSSDHRLRKLYIVSDGEVVGRGGCCRETGAWETGKDLQFMYETINSTYFEEELSLRQRRSARFQQRRRADLIAQEIKGHGYPPFIPAWMFPADTFSVAVDRPPNELLGPDFETLRAAAFDSLMESKFYIHQPPPHQRISKMEKELRAWCDEYCNSSKKLKEFRVEKNLFGWDLVMLEKELLYFLQTLPGLHSTDFEVTFPTTSSSIIIRPVNPFSKLFSLPGFFKFLLTITLVYPILWLLRYLFLGAQYDVVRAAFPLVYWATDHPSACRDVGHSQITSHRVLKGQTDRDWLKINQPRIIALCRSGKMGPVGCDDDS